MYDPQAKGAPMQLHGSGTTNPRLMLWKAMDLLERRAKVPIRMTYRAVGSSTGQKEFKGEAPNHVGLNNFGSGDIPFKTADYTALTTGAGAQEFAQVPFVMGAIAFFHTVPSSLPLDLNACLMARIFTTEIKTWDHTDILAFGNNQALASVLAGKAIKVVHRAYGSSSTSIATKYIQAATVNQNCASSWPANMTGKGNAEKQADGSYLPTKAPYWASSTFFAEGSQGVQDFLEANEFAITYLDKGHGDTLEAKGIKEVAIQNKAGKIVTSKTADLNKAAELSSTVPALLTDDWNDFSLLDVEGDTTWPMMTFSFLYVKKDMTSMGESGGLVKALAQHLLSAEGQASGSEFGFLPIPESLRVKGLNWITDETTLASAAVQWEFESATQAYTGQASHIFSVKRESYETNRIEDLIAKVQVLEASPAATRSPALTAGASANANTAVAEDDDHFVNTVIGIVALAIAALYAIGSAFIIKKLMDRVALLEKYSRQDDTSSRAGMVMGMQDLSQANAAYEASK